MSKHYPPLTYKDVIRGLGNNGFALKKQKGSHEHWAKVVEGKLYKVTVDKPKAPFSQFLIGTMARQAGVSKKKFYEWCGY